MKPGWYVKIRGTTKEIATKLFRIKATEHFRFVTGDPDFPETKAIFSAVATGGSAGANVDEVEPSKTPTHLFFLLWGVRTGGKYQIKIPTGVTLLGTDEDKTVGYIDAETSPYFAPNPDYAFWLINNYFPRIEFKNNTPVSITPQVYFEGRKYDIEEVTDATEKTRIESAGRFSIINIGGVTTTQ